MTSGGNYNYLTHMKNQNTCANRWSWYPQYGHMEIVVRLGAGAKPQPGPPRRPHNKSNLNLCETIYITRHIVGHVGNADFAKVIHVGGGHGVESGGLQ
jgi:hypothetical protein